MNEYSGSEEKLIEEEEEDFFDEISSSSNSGSALVDNILAGISKNQSYETQLDSALLTKSSIADVSIFPSKVRFSTTFPNIELKQKLLFSNSGMLDEHFTVRMTGDAEFTVEETEINLPAGNCYSLYVTFSPYTVSLFQASLIFEGRNSLVVTLLGHCVPSPLDFPSPASSLWKFPNSKSHRTFPFTNRSFSIALDVDFSVNSPSITVEPTHLSLDPGTSDHIVVTFDPNSANFRADPSLTIKCEKSGDNVTIPLQFIGPRSCTIVDFGVVAVGAFCTQSILLKSPQIAPLNIEWPFSITNPDGNGIEQPEFIFSFSSKRPGKYRQMLTFDTFDIELTAIASEPPFQMKVPQKFPNRPIEIRNTENRTIRFKFLAPQGYIIDTSEAVLRPNQVTKINVISEAGISGAPEIIIIWNNSEGKQITDHVPLPKDGESVAEPTEISIIDEPSAISISEILQSSESLSKTNKSVSPYAQKSKNKTQSPKQTDFSPNKNNSTHQGKHISLAKQQKNEPPLTERKKLPKKVNDKSQERVNKDPSSIHSIVDPQNISQKNYSKKNSSISDTAKQTFIENKPGFSSSAQFIPFFGVSIENQKSFDLSIYTDNEFSIVVPEFVSIPNSDKFASNVPFKLVSSYSPQSENTDYLKVVSIGQIAMQIPIISYRGSSHLEFDQTLIMKDKTATLNVHNSGERAAFITFALNNDSHVTVTPIARILNQYESQKFIFKFGSDPEKTGITVIYGDEIIRQIKAELRPTELYATQFATQKQSPELTFIKEPLFKCDRREIASVTRKYIKQTKLQFISNAQLTFSPAKLEYSSTSLSKKLIISNNGQQQINYKVDAENKSIGISASAGEIPPNSQIKLTVSISEPVNSSLKISCGKDIYIVPIEFIETSSIMIDNMTFSASQPVVDFGQVEIGLTDEMSIILTNHTDKDILLTIVLPKRSPFKCQQFAPIPANSTSKVPIEFSPTLDDVFEATMRIESKTDKLEIDLIGEGITAQTANRSDSDDSDCVVFPKCEPGIIRRAKVRVTNRTNGAVTIEANSSPPFICPIDVFQIEINSYVWFPVHFLPKAEGIYEGSLEFKADNGKLTIVMLKGICEQR